MKKTGFTYFRILLILLLLPITAVWGAEALVLHFSNGSEQSNLLDNIQRITFSSDDLVLKTTDNNTNNYVIDNLRKITFGNETPSAIANPPKPDNRSEVQVYITQGGEVVVKSSEPIKALTLFNTSGVILQETTRASFSISGLPAGIYILQVKTTNGTITKKFIKQ